MNASNDMGNELFELLSRCIGERDCDATNRLAEGEAELSKLVCSAPQYGRWIDGVTDFPFLIETLMLKDSIFSKEYPGVMLGFEERRRFAAELERHCETCERCGLKRAMDLDWKASVDRAFSENKEAIARAIARAAGKE